MALFARRTSSAKWSERLLVFRNSVKALKMEGFFRIRVLIHEIPGWCWNLSSGGVMRVRKRKIGLMTTFFVARPLNLATVSDLRSSFNHKLETFCIVQLFLKKFSLRNLANGRKIKNLDNKKAAPRTNAAQKLFNRRANSRWLTVGLNYNRPNYPLICPGIALS